MLAKLKKYLSDDVGLLIYKSMLFPYIDYVDNIFHKSNLGDLLQNRCLQRPDKKRNALGTR